jgi:hypothetical protein
MTTSTLSLPDGKPALAASPATRLGAPPGWARGVGAALALLILSGALGCGSSARTKTYDGVEMTLLSVSRMDVLQAVMESVRAANPDQELAVAQVQFIGASRNSVSLPATECELTDESGATYRPNRDVELTFGSGEDGMVWDFVFAVPKTAMLRSLRLGSITYDLGGVRDLDPSTRVTPGRHTRQGR